MKMHGLVAALAFGAAAAAPALASEELAKKNACTACHAVDRKLVGPAFKDIAEKYGKDPKNVDALAQKVRKGSVGVWGQVPMPPNAAVNEEEARKLVQWILTKK